MRSFHHHRFESAITCLLSLRGKSSGAKFESMCAKQTRGNSHDVTISGHAWCKECPRRGPKSQKYVHNMAQATKQKRPQTNVGHQDRQYKDRQYKPSNCHHQCPKTASGLSVHRGYCALHSLRWSPPQLGCGTGFMRHHVKQNLPPVNLC
jgi:hypothetical protein